ncbi:MAG TPA: 6-phosphogluconolactonase, partial [Phycisphaerae bacterium]|nr:6-phosphogluconolactonase [Phycisphaerae bacterium]
MRGASLTLGAADIGKADTSKQQVHVFDSSAEASASVAHAIVELIRERSREGRRAVLGLATGSTPQGVYDALVRLHREEGVSFANVVTFNLDEYWPMNPVALQSYHRFM